MQVKLIILLLLNALYFTLCGTLSLCYHGHSEVHVANNMQPAPSLRGMPLCHCEEGRSPDVAIYNCKFLASCHYSRRILKNVGSNLQNHSKRRQFHDYSRSFSRFFGSNSYVIARSVATWQSMKSLYRQIRLYRNLSYFFKKQVKFPT